MQSTSGESLQQLNPISIVSTPNEQRKRSNLNGSLELNFRINFSRRTSTDVLLILLTFEPTYMYIYIYIYIYICVCVLSIRHDSFIFSSF